MMRFLESLWLLVFLAGLLLTAVFGTWAETAPFWYGASLIASAAILSLISRPGKPAQTIKWSAVVVMLVFTVYMAWRGFTSEVQYIARPDLVFGGTAVITYLLVATRFTRPSQRIAILILLVLLIAGNTGLGLYQYFVNPRLHVLSMFGLRRGAEVSAGGFFVSANHFSGFLTLAAMPLLGVAVLGQGLRRSLRSLCTIGVALAAVGIAFSTSRGGVLAFLAGVGSLIVMTLMLARKQKSHARNLHSRTGLWLTGLAVGFLALLGGSAIVLKKFFNNSESLKNLNGRGPLWDAALEQWQEAPLLGTGARSYEYMERAYRTLDTVWMTRAGEVDAIHAHSDYLQCLADYGLIGLLLALLAGGWHVAAALRGTLRSYDKGSVPAPHGLARGLAVGSVAGLAGLMVQGIAEFNFHIGINVVMTGLLLGWMASPGFLSSTKNSVPADSKPKAGAGISGPLLAVSAIAAGMAVVLLDSAWTLAPADRAYRTALRDGRTAITFPELLKVSGTLREATILDPRNSAAWYMRGMANLQMASLINEKYAAPFYEDSLVQFNECLKLYPQNPYASAQAGNVSGYLGRLNEAEAHFRNALRWGANIQSVCELYGDFLLRQKRFQDAFGYLTTALHLSGVKEVRDNLQLKLNYCLKQFRKQGIAPPPEAFIHPAEMQPPAAKP